MYWSVCTGVYALEWLYWSVCTGVHVLEGMYWSVCTGMLVLECMYWSVYIKQARYCSNYKVMLIIITEH